MFRKKILKIINNNQLLFSLYLWINNYLKLKNKINVKGCTVNIGKTKLDGLKIQSNGQGNEVVIGDNVKIVDCTIGIYGNNNKIIIGNSSALNQVDFYIEDSQNEISVGADTHLCGKTHLAAIEGTKITIGSNCLFSSDLHFRTGDSHSIVNLEGERINPSKDIIIEDHVWIGTKVTCLKGVRVSRNSVVAATTTLCKDYDLRNVVIAGVPGKIIKQDINWSEARK